MPRPRAFRLLPLEQLVEPAVHYAREGFEADPSIRLQIASNMPNLARYKETARVFMPDGYPPPPGAKVVQRDLADTLERIGREGKNALHKGEIAAAIDEEMRRNDGLLTARDLAEYEAEVRHPVNTSLQRLRTAHLPRDSRHDYDTPDPQHLGEL